MENRSGRKCKRRGNHQSSSTGNGREKNQGGRRGGNTFGNFCGEKSSAVMSEYLSEESEVENEVLEKNSDKENESKFKRPSTCPEQNKVFEYFIKVGGPSSLTKIANSNLFPEDFDISSWFYSHRRQFILFENKQKIHFIIPFYKKAKFCLDYNGLGKRKQCDKPDCHHAHVCKDFIGGSCKEGGNCQFSHDFLDRVNSGLVRKLGLNMFNNDEIRLIYSHRFPHVCYKHKFERICHRPVCAYLHICCEFLFGRCELESTCPWGHSLRTDQNKYVLTAYQMAHWEEHLIKKMVFTLCSSVSESKTSSPNPVGGAKPKELSPRHRSMDEDSISSKDFALEKDAAQSIPICHSFVAGECKTDECIYLHIGSIKWPYIWQIWMSDKWHTIDKSQMSKVEEDYCNRKSRCSIMISYGGNNYIATFHFKRTDMMTALIMMIGQNSSSAVDTKVRRLSTMSYAEGTKLSAKASFQTQWRWFFQDDSKAWILFNGELLQFTLEQKYTRKCQETYLFFRDNYRFQYRVDFKLMKQTNLDTTKERKLLRRPIFVSPDDVKSKHYPTMISIPTGANTCVPRDWTPWDLAHKFEFVELQRDSSEFKTVENSFFTTLHYNMFHISYIYRVQNMDLWNAYHGQKKSMKGNLERGGQTKKVDERSLFHGTDSLDSVRGICTNCFDFRVCGKHATSYGKGAYFACDAKYSHKYTKHSKLSKERYMFLAKVLVGEYAVGSSSYTRPPEKLGGTAHQLFDSCVDNVINPSIFVVFDFKQCYPTYLICYQRLKEQLPVREETSFSPSNNATLASNASQLPSTQSSSSPRKTSSSAITFNVTASPALHSGSDSTTSRPSSHTAKPPSVAPITLNNTIRNATSVIQNKNATPSYAFQSEPAKSRCQPTQSHIHSTQSTSSPQRTSSSAVTFSVTASTALHSGSDSTTSRPSSHTVNSPSVAPITLNNTVRKATSVLQNNNATPSLASQFEPAKSRCQPTQSHIQSTQSTSSPQRTSYSAVTFNVTASTTALHSGSDSTTSRPSSHTVNPLGVSPITLNTTSYGVSHKVNSSTSSPDSAANSSQKQQSQGLNNMSSSSGSWCSVQ